MKCIVLDVNLWLKSHFKMINFVAVCLFVFFVISKAKRMLSAGAIDCSALTTSPWTRRRRWKVRAARSEKTCVITNARSILISSPPFTFDNLFGFARGRRYRGTRERSTLDTQRIEGLSSHARIFATVLIWNRSILAKRSTSTIYLFSTNCYVCKLSFSINDTNIHLKYLRQFKLMTKIL